ncbi:MAG: DUF29 domain-containing protein [Gomphosphaeria aponina SAG 52.96 = DSM 107014]|uniref:DUF29 domain-containing protein n=1 Tax=Gomphosphaeria aponina SAG 52.96 = DSM 107014 TaxID=1521640 RepID=A0A941GV30_9CHRO|nr:DUF29 domain-containing protein [Gomphosphaeria aponina SAG 52.96 = DSM 107014]
MIKGTISEKKQKSLYEQDYHLWLITTANQLEENNIQDLDIHNLLEEIESMGRSEKNGLQSNLQIVLMHLLKYKYQPEKRSNSWRYTILEHRDRIAITLENSPSLKSYVGEIFDKCYQKARKKAATETGLPLNKFPSDSPFTIENTLNEDYLPE